MMTRQGKKKMKKKQIALGVSQHNHFLFGQAEGLASDDSDDSDYQPNDLDQPSTSKQKRKGGKSLSRSQPATKKFRKTESKPRSTSLDWSHRIPNELLYKILMSAVCNFSAVPLLCRVSCVCQKWHVVASNPSLWCTIDLSYMSLKATDATLKSMTAQTTLKHVQHISFSGWQNLTASGLELILTHCSELQTIDLSRCKKIGTAGVCSIGSHCQKLASINLSYIQTDATSPSSIKNLLYTRGMQLEALYLKEVKYMKSPTIYDIQTFCRNLKILDLSAASILSLPFDIERLQIRCPHLVELRLSELSLVPTRVIANQLLESSATGFPNLELLSLARVSDIDGTNDNFLERLLKTSSKLRQLDLRGCHKITHRALVNLRAVSLEQLFLSGCDKVSWRELFNAIKARWSSSLKELNVSWCKRLDDAALMILAGATDLSIMKLDLAGTGVGTLGVRSMIDSCYGLTALNLTSCRGVPRGVKQFHDAVSIKKLRTHLHSIKEQVEVIQ